MTLLGQINSGQIRSLSGGLFVKPALGILEHLEDGGVGPSRFGSSSIGPLEDLAWICVRGPLFEIKEDRVGLLGSFSMESTSEGGPRAIGDSSNESSPVGPDLS